MGKKDHTIYNSCCLVFTITSSATGFVRSSLVFIVIVKAIVLGVVNLFLSINFHSHY